MLFYSLSLLSPIGTPSLYRIKSHFTLELSATKQGKPHVLWRHTAPTKWRQIRWSGGTEEICSYRQQSCNRVLSVSWLYCAPMDAMSDPRRLHFTTIGPMGKEKKKKSSLPPTIRFTLALRESNDKTCPEFSYADLMKNALVSQVLHFHYSFMAGFGFSDTFQLVCLFVVIYFVYLFIALTCSESKIKLCFLYCYENCSTIKIIYEDIENVLTQVSLLHSFSHTSIRIFFFFFPSYLNPQIVVGKIKLGTGKLARPIRGGKKKQIKELIFVLFQFFSLPFLFVMFYQARL